MTSRLQFQDQDSPPSQLTLQSQQGVTIHSPLNYSDDPYFNGLFTAYGPPQAFSQLVGFSTARLPLPFELADDGPIFVNAKQYHGILRRRQMRAKLEAQNKLVKTRKPYMHESRHLHAVNRVRGSGGRFLSSKKLHHHHHHSPSSSPNSTSAINSVQAASMSATAP